MKKFASLQIRSRGATKTEKLTAKCEDHDFCELWKRDVRTLEAALRRLFLNVFAIARPPLKYYSLKLFCKFGERARRRTQRILNTRIFRQECPFEIYLMLSQDGQRVEVIRLNTLPTRPSTTTCRGKERSAWKKKQYWQHYGSNQPTRESENSAAEGCRSHRAKAYI